MCLCIVDRSSASWAGQSSSCPPALAASWSPLGRQRHPHTGEDQGASRRAATGGGARWSSDCQFCPREAGPPAPSSCLEGSQQAHPSSGPQNTGRRPGDGGDQQETPLPCFPLVACGERASGHAASRPDSARDPQQALPQTLLWKGAGLAVAALSQASEFLRPLSSVGLAGPRPRRSGGPLSSRGLLLPVPCELWDCRLLLGAVRSVLRSLLGTTEGSAS